jgi:hypothetical protein
MSRNQTENLFVLVALFCLRAGLKLMAHGVSIILNAQNKTLHYTTTFAVTSSRTSRALHKVHSIPPVLQHMLKLINSKIMRFSLFQIVHTATQSLLFLLHVYAELKAVFRIRIWSRSGFNYVSGSGSGFEINESALQMKGR